MDSATLAAWIGGVGLPLLVLVGGVVWYLLRSQIEGATKTADEAKSDAGRARTELAEYKLTVAEKYASIAYLKDVETRILNAISEMKTQFTEFVRDYHDTNRPSR